jgi:hypothetical protein
MPFPYWTFSRKAYLQHGHTVIFMMPCSLHLSQLMGNAAKLLLVCSYLVFWMNYLRMMVHTVIFMMPCSLQLLQLMGNAAKLLVCSYLVFWMNCLRMMVHRCALLRTCWICSIYGLTLLRCMTFWNRFSCFVCFLWSCLFYAIGNVLLLLLLLLLKRQCVPAFIRMWIAGVPCKLFSWRRLMECGVLKEVIGKVVIFCMKCLSTILASYTLKNAMQMIHMLERLLGVSVCQQFCEIVQLFPCSEIMQLCWSSQYVCICILCIQMCKIPLILCCFFVRATS